MRVRKEEVKEKGQSGRHGGISATSGREDLQAWGGALCGLSLKLRCSSPIRGTRLLDQMRRLYKKPAGRTSICPMNASNVP